MDSPDQLDRRERWDQLVLPDLKDPKAPLDHVVLTDSPDHQDLQEDQETQEHRDLQDSLVPVESPDTQVSEERLENAEARDLLETMGAWDQLAHVAHLDHLELQDP